MDTFTHALSGALAARATAPRIVAAGEPPLHVRTWLGFGAAIFPDIDFLLRFVDPLLFLHLHRAVTHSLLLLPLWAVLLGTVSWWGLRRAYRLRPLVLVAAMALAIHIAGDVITAYGTKILWPISGLAPAPAWVVVIDPWLTGLLVVVLLISRRWPRPAVAAGGVGLIAAAVLLQAGLNQAAARLGERHALAIGWTDARVRALAQPLSPFNRAVIVERDGEYLRARVNLLREIDGTTDADAPVLWRLYRSYRPPTALDWRRFAMLPPEPGPRELAAMAWRSQPLTPYRDFAHHPVLYRMDTHPGGPTCVWFTDLRYWYDPLPAPFRFGACRDAGEPWRLDELPVRFAEIVG